MRSRMPECEFFMCCSKTEVVCEGEKMGDYYHVYCIYILIINSFTPKVFYFDFYLCLVSFIVKRPSYAVMQLIFFLKLDAYTS